MFVNGHEYTFQLSPHGKILIVGGNSKNFDQKYREHKQLIFWYSSDPRTSRKEYIPKDVEVIFLTRWIDHRTTERLQKIAKGRQFQSSWRVTQIGDIKVFTERLLAESLEKREKLAQRKAEVFPEPRVLVSCTRASNDDGNKKESTITGGQVMTASATDKETKEVERTERTKVRKGELKNFMEQNANFSTSNKKEEITRLFILAKETGIPTTQKSVSVRFSELKVKRDEKLNQPTLKNSRIRNPQQILEKFKKNFAGLQKQGEKLVRYIETLEAENQRLKAADVELKKIKETIKAMST